MSTFNFLYSNYGEAPTAIEDLVIFLKAALREAGHSLNLSSLLETGSPHIVAEYFPDQMAESLSEAARKGIKLAVIATEFPTGNMFNNFNPAELIPALGKDEISGPARYQNFMKVAEACQTVWCLSQDQMDSYAKILPPEWLHLLPLGYVDGFASVPERPSDLKDYDFIFTGTLTPRRKQILMALKDAGTRVNFFRVGATQAYLRSHAVSRARICLGLKPTESWGYPSAMRAYYHLMNNAFLISERTQGALALDPYLTLAEPDGFLTTCLETLKRDDLAAVASHRLARFRDEIPLKPVFRDFLASNGF